MRQVRPDVPPNLFHQEIGLTCCWGGCKRPFCNSTIPCKPRHFQTLHDCRACVTCCGGQLRQALGEVGTHILPALGRVAARAPPWRRRRRGSKAHVLAALVGGNMVRPGGILLRQDELELLALEDAAGCCHAVCLLAALCEILCGCVLVPQQQLLLQQQHGGYRVICTNRTSCVLCCWPAQVNNHQSTLG